MNKKLLALIFAITILVGGTAIAVSVSYSGTRGPDIDKKVDTILDVTVTDIRGDEDWNRAQRELEPRYKEFLARASSIQQTTKAPGLNMSICEPFIIRDKPPEYLPLSVEITHTDYKTPTEDALHVKDISVYYKEQLRFDVNKELEPVGKELEELRGIEKELRRTQDPEEFRELVRTREELKKKIEEGTTVCIMRIPAELLSDIKPGDILTFPVTIRIEHNGKEMMLETGTMAFVGHPLKICEEEINELSNSLMVEWNSAFYAGDQHTHSTYSDGSGTIADMANAAQSSGFSYVVITDHSYDIDDDSLGSDKIYPHNSSTWQEIGEDCVAATTIDFATIRGEEISCDEGDSHGTDPMHYLAYDIDLCVGSYHLVFPDELPEVPDFEDYWYNDKTVFDFVEDPENKDFGNKGFGAVAHPNMPYFGIDRDTLLGVVGYGGIEAWNWAVGQAIDVWQARLDQGYYCYGYGSSDAHDVGHLGTVWAWTYATDINEDYILDNLGEGYVTFADGPFVTYWVNGSDGNWYPVGTKNVVDTWPLEIYVHWKSWPASGPINDISLVTWDGYRIFLFNPDAEGSGYEGSALVTIDGSGTGCLMTRLEAETSNGNEGYTNPIWSYYT